jgi:hypothetical protein
MFRRQYEKYSNEFFDYAVEHHTTEKLVEYVLGEL